MSEQQPAPAQEAIACGSRFGNFECELPAGHDGKHSSGPNSSRLACSWPAEASEDDSAYRRLTCTGSSSCVCYDCIGPGSRSPAPVATPPVPTDVEALRGAFMAGVQHERHIVRSLKPERPFMTSAEGFDAYLSRLAAVSPQPGADPALAQPGVGDSAWACGASKSYKGQGTITCVRPDGHRGRHRGPNGFEWGWCGMETSAVTTERVTPLSGATQTWAAVAADTAHTSVSPQTAEGRTQELMRSAAEDAFFAGVLHGEKRNGVPIHEAFEGWWPKGAIR